MKVKESKDNYAHLLRALFHLFLHLDAGHETYKQTRVIRGVLYEITYLLWVDIS